MTDREQRTGNGRQDVTGRQLDTATLCASAVEPSALFVLAGDVGSKKCVPTSPTSLMAVVPTVK